MSHYTVRMRLFTGIDLPEEVQDKLERFLAHVRPTAHLMWSPVYNLHITTKFIGEWPEEDLEKLTSALRGIRRGAAIPIAIRDVGWFPSSQSPRVFWAGIHAGTPLANLAQSTEEALEPLGIVREQRSFSPHLTLARIRRPVPLNAMRQAIGKFESLDFGSLDADRFHLYVSRPGSAGTVYTRLAEFRLSGA